MTSYIYNNKPRFITDHICILHLLELSLIYQIQTVHASYFQLIYSTGLHILQEVLFFLFQMASHKIVFIYASIWDMFPRFLS